MLFASFHYVPLRSLQCCAEREGRRCVRFVVVVKGTFKKLTPYPHLKRQGGYSAVFLWIQKPGSIRKPQQAGACILTGWRPGFENTYTNKRSDVI